MSVLGNPEEATPLTITDVVQTITISQGLTAVEFQNTGSSPCGYGKSATLTYARGRLIYENGDFKTFENIPSGWKISFICGAGKSTTLRQINYV